MKSIEKCAGISSNLNIAFVSFVSGCVSISAFASLAQVCKGETSTALYWKSKKCPDFGKTGPDYVHPDANTSDDEFVSVNDVLREYNEMNEKIKNL